MGSPTAKKVGAKARVWELAPQIWVVLVALIMTSERDPDNPSRPTLAEVAERIGMPAGPTLNKALAILGRFCVMNDLPSINSVIVDETQELENHCVLREGYTVAEEQAAVMRQNWFLLRVPTGRTLRRVAYLR